jgi:predicted outer membrane protein
MWTTIRRAFGPLSIAALCVTPAFSHEATQKSTPPSAINATKPVGRSEVNQRTANKPVIADQSPAQVDQMIAGMLALCNEEEAAVGKFASEHAQHADVKKFANMMFTEHAQMAKQLQKWAPEATLKGNDPSIAETSASSTTPFDPMRVHQQIAVRSLASAKKSMTAKKGADFDMAYVGSQCVLHQQMIDKASVLRQYASPELQAAIDKGITSAESHLNHAHQLIDALASADKAGN